MRLQIVIMVCCLLACSVAVGQDESVPLPQGSAIPGISIPMVGGERGFIELGGGHSGLSQGNPSWTDGYLRTAVSTGPNTLHGEISRQNRYGDTGWYFSGGLTHIFSQNWYADGFVGFSSRNFFLPKYRVDGFIHRKLLPNKQLIATLGVGHDQAKDIHSANRLNPEVSYYLPYSMVVQGGIIFNRSNPGAVMGHAQYFAVTQGRNKAHYVALRGEWGREAWELVGPATALVNLPLHDVTATWRQWLAPNWGFNASVERYVYPKFNGFGYNRTGATLGLFLDF